MKNNPDLWNERTPTMLKLVLQPFCFCSNDQVWVTFGVEMTSDQIICVETDAKKWYIWRKYGDSWTHACNATPLILTGGSDPKKVIITVQICIRQGRSQVQFLLFFFFLCMY